MIYKPPQLCSSFSNGPMGQSLMKFQHRSVGVLPTNWVDYFPLPLKGFSFASPFHLPLLPQGDKEVGKGEQEAEMGVAAHPASSLTIMTVSVARGN